MSERAPVGALDGIVVLELAIADREAELVAAVLEMGLAAWEKAPQFGAADIVINAARHRQVTGVLEELRAETGRVQDEQRAALRARGKGDTMERR